MSERDVRAAEWSAFAALLHARGEEMGRRGRELDQHREYLVMSTTLLAVALDAYRLAESIRDGAPPAPEESSPS